MAICILRLETRFQGALKLIRFVQNLVVRHGNPAVRYVQYMVG